VAMVAALTVVWVSGLLEKATRIVYRDSDLGTWPNPG